ncbi:MAG TPA: metallophosphoesterase [Terriglobia bacterium]|jgi:predicted MPP superfamily phosphohydrolase
MKTLRFAFTIPLFYLLLSAAAPAAPERVVAIGDIHGDFDAFTGILQRAHLIDPMLRWAGENATLVQLGDFLDRGPKARQVMDLLMSLQKSAPRQGGRVIVLMGNHEAMNLYGDFRYVTANDYASFAQDRVSAKRHQTLYPGRPAGFSERCEALSADGIYGKWIRTLPAIVRINDSIFLHGGINPELASSTVEELNNSIAAEIRSFDAFKDYMVHRNLAQPCSTLDELISAARNGIKQAKGKDGDRMKAFLTYATWLSINPNGPLWFRGYAEWTDAEGAPQIEKLIKAFDVSRFVVGHTPQPGNIVSRFDGKVYLIDTGMLSGYVPGGRASALTILDGKITFIY